MKAVEKLKALCALLCVCEVPVCLIVSYRVIGLQSTISLLTFNVLFVSLPFQLKGSLNRKMGLLALGNVVGLVWNFIFNSLLITATDFFGTLSLNIYAVFFPFLSFFWIISFWSLSLTVLRQKKGA